MKVKSFVFILFFLTCFLFTTSILFSQQDDWYYEKPIRDIVFSGLRNFQSSELEALMNPYKGRPFTEDLFFEILGKLYALEYFETIDPSTVRANPEGSEVIIRFAVTERPIVRRINFIGNSSVRRHELNEAITTKVDDIYNQTKIRADVEAIRLKYVEKGYPNATVTVDESFSANGVTINFRITESERISIIRIDFEGNSRFSDNTLRSQISLKARTLRNAGAFQESKLIEDREAIAKYYHDRGYIDAVVRDVTRTYGEDSRGTNLILTFMIDEGEEYRLGGINFEGNRIFTTDQLNRLVTSKRGDVVNATRVEMDLQRVIDLYLENGYFSNSMIRTAERDTQAKTITFTLNIVERNRAYIENLTIVGNQKTRDHVILREIPLEPGDVFSKTKIMDALRNLYNLQYFSIVFPDTSQGSEENLMDLVFVVEEQQTTSIQFGITFSGSADPETFPISGMIEWTDKNLAGTGNELGVKINSSIIDSTEFSVNYLHRWFLGLPLSLGIDVSAVYSKRLATTDNSGWFNGDEPYAFPDGFTSYEEYLRYDKLPSREYLMNYDQWYISLGFSSRYSWSTAPGILALSGGFRLGLVKNSYDDILRPFDPALRAANNTWTPKNSLSITLSLDQRDIFYDPSRGYFISERMGLYGFFDNEIEHYLRSDTKLQYFHTLFDIPVKFFQNWNFKCVFAFHTGLSVIFVQPWRGSDPAKMPIEEANKLAVDGMFVGRGWSSAYRNKGLLLLDSWIELRFPLIRGILAFDLFFDMAGVESREGYYFGNDNDGKPNFTINNLRFSFGAGFRFTMPQFPIRISLAKRFMFENDQFKWMPGYIFDESGFDLVISFAFSY